MAISRGVGRLLLDLARRDGWSGDVLQLGRQSVYLTRREVDRRRGPLSRVGTFVDDRAFFSALGFDGIFAADLAGRADTTHVIDLNEPVGGDVCGRYDAVFDGGTLICLFDVPRALRNVEAMLRPGGRAIHVFAANGGVDDRYYQLSPRLLHEWYAARGHDVEHIVIGEVGRRWQRGRLRALRYEPGSLDALTIAGFERGLLVTVVVARRGDAVVERVPYLEASSRADALGPLARRLAALVRPLLPTRVIRVWPRRLPPSAGRW